MMTLIEHLIIILLISSGIAHWSDILFDNSSFSCIFICIVSSYIGIIFETEYGLWSRIYELFNQKRHR